MLRNFLIRHKKGSMRFFEILPGLVSWNLILFPYWGIFVIPEAVAYFILLFNVYWFYQAFGIAVTATISHLRIQASQAYDWLSDVKNFPDWQKVKHVIIVPTVKEPLHILDRTLTSLKNQTFPTSQLVVVIAQEYKAPQEHRDKIKKALTKKYQKVFKNLFFTLHQLAPGEAVGKASNERYAAIWIKKNYLDKNKINLDYITITSCDADHVFHPKHFAVLAYKFLDNPKRYQRFWQPAVLLYNNIWRLPAITRVPNVLASIFILSMLPRRDRLINQQNYSLSFKLLHNTGYWDPDKIPEDWGIFFKAFFKNKGKIEVEPLYLPLYADAMESTSLWRTLKGQYNQVKRWAWGVSDSSWVIYNYLTAKGLSFWDKTTRVSTFIHGHFLWPVHWFVITIGLSLPVIINPAFGRTTLGYLTPKISSAILTLALAFLVILLILDYLYKPRRPKSFPLWRAIVMPLEFILMPVATFFFTTLPGLDAHTRLMLGKYIEYKVTEKV
jgi:hypothetical protein